MTSSVNNISVDNWLLSVLQYFMFGSLNVLSLSLTLDLHPLFPPLPPPSATSFFSVPSVSPALKSPFPRAYRRSHHRHSHQVNRPTLIFRSSRTSLFSLFCKKSQKLNSLLSASSPLFKKEYSNNSFPINSFRTLLQNTGVGLLQAKNPSVQIPRVSSFHDRIPFKIIFFAHAHHLTPIESHSCKKQGGGGWGQCQPRPSTSHLHGSRDTRHESLDRDQSTGLLL